MPVRGKENKKLQKINDDNFNLIKTLAASGVSKASIVRALGLSPSTIYRVLACETVQDYRDGVNADSDKARAKKQAKTEGERLVEQIAQIERTPVEINFTEAQAEIVIEVLNKILEKVSLIADNNKPKGFFH